MTYGWIFRTFTTQMDVTRIFCKGTHVNTCAVVVWRCVRANSKKDQQSCDSSPHHLKLKTGHNVRKCTFGHVRPVMIQISLRIRAVWSESSLAVVWIAKDAKFLHADNEDSDRIRRLIWVFVEHTCKKVRFLTLRLLKFLKKSLDILKYPFEKNRTEGGIALVKTC